jgi:hypothetical protein
MKTKSENVKVVSPLSVGTGVFIRTVTSYFTGRVVGLTRDAILLEQAAWIASTGRFADALATGALDEIEPYPAGSVVVVMKSAVVDVCEWKHALPTQVK